MPDLLIYHGLPKEVFSEGWVLTFHLETAFSRTELGV